MADLDKERREQYRRKVAEDFPERLEFPEFRKKLSLRYGINPGGPAAFYAEEGASGPNMANFKVLQEGRGLGYINTADLDLGQSLVKTLHDDYPESVVYVIVKHEMPSGVAIGRDSILAFEDAWVSDPLSSFGGVHVTSGRLEESVAKELIDKEKNVEAIFAPSYSPEALDILKGRKDLRVLQMQDINLPAIDNGLDYKRVEGGMLIQYRWKTRIHTAQDLECVSVRQPTLYEINAARFTWKVAGFTRSNAVILGTPYRTHGIGSGQRSRIAAAVQAVDFANGFGERYLGFGSKGTFMASDAYMPSTDVVELAAQHGITGIVFPLGSLKDKEVIDAADEHGLTLLATRKPGEKDSERCFTHR